MDNVYKDIIVSYKEIWIFYKEKQRDKTNSNRKSNQNITAGGNEFDCTDMKNERSCIRFSMLISSADL